MTMNFSEEWTNTHTSTKTPLDDDKPIVQQQAHPHEYYEYEYEYMTEYTEQQLRWIQEQRTLALNSNSNLTVQQQQQQKPMKLFYRTQAGLGHQFVRIAAVYHIATLYKIPRIYLTANPACGGDIFTIYNYLIGEGPILVNMDTDMDINTDMNINTDMETKMGLPLTLPSEYPNLTWTTNVGTNSNGNVYINNDVPGYTQPKYRMSTYLKTRYDTNYGKNVTDYQVYKQLMALFYHKHKDRIQQVTNATRFYDHTVFALHVRTGNGEKGDFTDKGRDIKDLDVWIHNVVKLLCDYRNDDDNTHLFSKKPLMIYVGTDTGSVIPKLQNASNALCGSGSGSGSKNGTVPVPVPIPIPIVSAAQEYPEEGKSVSFQQKHKGQKCLESWESMFLDMYLFTQSNSVIAGSYSSFTQSAPLSIVFEKARLRARMMAKMKMKEEQEEDQGQHTNNKGNNTSDRSRSNSNSNINNRHPHYFCNVGKRGDSMDCFDNFRGWLAFEPAGRFGNWNSIPGATEKGVRVEVQFPSKPIVPITNLFAESALRLAQ